MSLTGRSVSQNVCIVPESKRVCVCVSVSREANGGSIAELKGASQHFTPLLSEVDSFHHDRWSLWWTNDLFLCRLQTETSVYSDEREANSGS